MRSAPARWLWSLNWDAKKTDPAFSLKSKAFRSIYWLTVNINLIMKLACKNEQRSSKANQPNHCSHERTFRCHLTLGFCGHICWVVLSCLYCMYGMSTLMIWSSAQFVCEASSLIHKQVACLCWLLERLAYLSAILGEKVISYLLWCFCTKSMKSVSSFDSSQDLMEFFVMFI